MRDELRSQVYRQMIALAGLWRCFAHGVKVLPASVPVSPPVDLSPQLEARRVFSAAIQGTTSCAGPTALEEQAPFLQPYAGHWVLSSAGAVGCLRSGTVPRDRRAQGPWAASACQMAASAEVFSGRFLAALRRGHFDAPLALAPEAWRAKARSLGHEGAASSAAPSSQRTHQVGCAASTTG